MSASEALQSINLFASFAAAPIRRRHRQRQPVTNEWNNSSNISFAKIRIKKELNELLSDPIEDISCGPIEKEDGEEDIFHWTAVFNGPKLTPYANGIYHLRIDFPTSYPMKCPQIRYNTKLCKCYHKNVDVGGYIISMNKLTGNNQNNSLQNNDDNWWNLSMGIRDVLIQIRNMLCDDELSDILTPPRRQTHLHRLGYMMDNNTTDRSSDLLVKHIVKIGINNQRWCHGKPLPIWLLKQTYNDNILKINKSVHDNNIQQIKQLFYDSTTLCIGIIDEIIVFYGNEWICGKLWTEYENYKPLTQFIENECRDKLSNI